MILKVELTWWNGIVPDDEPEAICEPDYDLLDAETGRFLADEPFGCYEAVEEFIARNYPDSPRWVPDEIATDTTLDTVLDRIEREGRASGLSRPVLKNVIVGHLYQYRHSEEQVRRMRAALETIRDWT